MVNLIGAIQVNIFNIIIDVIGIIILFMILFNLRLKAKFTSLDKKLFIGMVFAIVAMLIIDILLWVVEGVPGLGNANRIINCLYFMFNPLVVFLWLIYVDYKLFDNTKGLKKRIIFYLIPFVINFCLSVANLFTDFIFTIAEGNHYQRLDGVYLCAVFLYSYIFYCFTITIIFRKNISKRVFFGLIIFDALPCVCSLIQLLLNGISLLVSEALAALIAFIHFQNDNVATDSLTGLYNRHYLEEYLINRLKNQNNKELFFGIMIDIDDFKMINDTFSHLTGDRAIIEMANLLQASTNNSEIVTRYAGDEFIILSQSPTNMRIIEIISNLKENTQIFNDTSHEQFVLKYSLGYYIAKSDDTLESFLKNIDNNMYLDKNTKKKIKL